MTSDLRETRLALPVYRPAKWLVRTLVCQPDRHAMDYPNAAGMKRLYLRKSFRRAGLGRQLAEAVLVAARMTGYHCVLLDTLDDMESARALYVELGFAEIPPYYHNPIAGAHYLKLDI